MNPSVLLPAFPKQVENWWWEQARQKWSEMGEEKMLNLMRREIVEQSDRFNKDRSFDPSAYGSRDLSILAYGNFYFSRTWMAMTFAVGEAFTRCNWQPPVHGPLRILDLGCGTGASGFSTLYLLRNLGVKNPIELHTWDYSGKSLSYLQELGRACSDLWPNVKIVGRRMDLRELEKERRPKKFDLILLGYSLNELIEEMEIQTRMNWIDKISQFSKHRGAIVLTEPAESEICKSLHDLSAQVSENKQLKLLAPYFNGMPCPMHARGAKFFSHEVRKYPPLITVERINRPLNLEIREVKFGLSILSPTAPPQEEVGANLFRVISPVRKRKGAISLLGMASNGIEYLYEFQRRNLSKDEIDLLMYLERGDILRVSEKFIESHSENRIRLKSPSELVGEFVPRLKNKN